MARCKRCGRYYVPTYNETLCPSCNIKRDLSEDPWWRFEIAKREILKNWEKWERENNLRNLTAYLDFLLYHKRRD